MNIRASSAWLVLLLAVNAHAGVWSTVKENTKEAAEDVKEGSKSVWQEVKKTGKAVGKTTKETAREIKGDLKEKLD